MRLILIAVLFLAVSPLALSQDSKEQLFVYGGFMNTQDFLGMSKDGQRGFVQGLVDGIFLAPFFDAPDHGKSLEVLHACVKGMNDVQVTAIITKYINDHPEAWHLQLNVESLNALRLACPAK